MKGARQRPQSHPRPSNASLARKKQHPMAYRPPRAVAAPAGEKKSIAVCVLLAFLAIAFWFFYLQTDK